MKQNIYSRFPQHFRNMLKYSFSIVEPCELLRIDKDDFNTLLKSCSDTEWSVRLSALQSLPAMADWTKDELVALNNHCQILEYPANKVSTKTD